MAGHRHGALRNESIERVVASLDLAMPVADGSSVARSAITQARTRVGSAPLEHLFAVTSAAWAEAGDDAHRWRGLSVYAVDGSTLRVPDSRENWAAFGGQTGSATRGGSAYPTVRLVALMAARTHVLTALVHADYHTGGPLAGFPRRCLHTVRQTEDRPGRHARDDCQNPRAVTSTSPDLPTGV